MPHSSYRRVGTVAARVVGSVIGALFAIVGRVRPAAKPLHPRGRQFTGALQITGTSAGTGGLDIPWSRDDGSYPVLARLSRSAGLPPPFPDVFGLALRVQHTDGIVDLLFSTTGTGRWGRFLLVPRRSLFSTYTTLMPYRTGSGPVTLRADIAEERTDLPVRGGGVPLPLTILLSVARPRRSWQAFGTVRLMSPASPDDPPVSFDALLHEPPGLSSYRWARLLREPSYAAARRSREPRGTAAVRPTGRTVTQDSTPARTG